MRNRVIEWAQAILMVLAVLALIHFASLGFPL